MYYNNNLSHLGTRSKNVFWLLYTAAAVDDLGLHCAVCKLERAAPAAANAMQNANIIDNAIVVRS